MALKSNKLVIGKVYKISGSIFCREVKTGVVATLQDIREYGYESMKEYQFKLNEKVEDRTHQYCLTEHVDGENPKAIIEEV